MICFIHSIFKVVHRIFHSFVFEHIRSYLTFGLVTIYFQILIYLILTLQCWQGTQVGVLFLHTYNVEFLYLCTFLHTFCIFFTWRQNMFVRLFIANHKGPMSTHSVLWRPVKEALYLFQLYPQPSLLIYIYIIYLFIIESARFAAKVVICIAIYSHMTSNLLSISSDTLRIRLSTFDVTELAWLSLPFICNASNTYF